MIYGANLHIGRLNPFAGSKPTPWMLQYSSVSLSVEIPHLFEDSNSLFTCPSSGIREQYECHQNGGWSSQLPGSRIDRVINSRNTRYIKVTDTQDHDWRCISYIKTDAFIKNNNKRRITEKKREGEKRRKREREREREKEKRWNEMPGVYQINFKAAEMNAVKRRLCWPEVTSGRYNPKGRKPTAKSREIFYIHSLFPVQPLASITQAITATHTLNSHTHTLTHTNTNNHTHKQTHTNTDRQCFV